MLETADKGYEAMKWLSSLDEIDALSNIATWLTFTIAERKMDVADTMRLINALVLEGVPRRLGEMENDRER